MAAVLKPSTLQCQGECSTFVLRSIAINLQYDIFIAVKSFIVQAARSFWIGGVCHYQSLLP